MVVTLAAVFWCHATFPQKQLQGRLALWLFKGYFASFTCNFSFFCSPAILGWGLYHTRGRVAASGIATYHCIALQSLHSRYDSNHPRRPRGSQSGREKRRDESFQVRAKEPLGTDSHRTISKNSSGCHLLIGHKKCFVLLCPIGQQFLLSFFREFVHDSYCFDHGLSGSCTKNARSYETFSLIKNPHLLSKYCLLEN